MLKKILVGSFIAIALLGATFSYFYLRNIKKPQISASEVIPSQASIVFESANFLSLFQSLERNNLIWEELKPIKPLNIYSTYFKQIDSLFSTDEKFAAVFENSSVYLSFIPTESKNSNWILSFNLPDVNYDQEAIDFLKVHTQKFKEARAKDISEKIFFFDWSEKSYCCYITSGLVILAEKSEIIASALSSIGKSNLMINSNFREVKDLSGTQSQLRIYYNQKTSIDWLKDNLLPNISYALLFSNQQTNWSGLDIDFKPNEILLNGFSSPDSNSFLYYLKTQNPQQFGFEEIVPASSVAFAFIGIENYKSFLTARNADQKELKKSIQWMTEQLDVTPLMAIEKAGGHEIVNLFVNEGQYDYSYGIIHLDDTDAADEIINAAKSNTVVFNKSVEEKDSIVYTNHSELFSVLAGNLFTTKYSYLYRINDYLICADSDTSMLYFINAYNSERTLRNDKEYKHFLDGNLSSESNLFLYSNLNKGEKRLSKIFNEDFTYHFEANRSSAEKFQAFGIQLSARKDLLFTQAYLLFNPQSKEENNSIWETLLDTTISTNPTITINHKTGGNEIFAQDDANKIYLISNTGKIQWSKKINEKIIGGVKQIDVLKNNKLQYIFNSSNFIHVIDRNGNYVQGFPIRLMAPASCPISVFDYDNNRDYRIIACCNNLRVYDYKTDGRMVEGFTFEGSKAPIKNQIQHHKIQDKDYLSLIDSLGNIYLCGRRGETRIKFENKLPINAKGIWIHPGKDIKKTFISAFDPSTPRIVTISFAGEFNQQLVDIELKASGVERGLVNDDQMLDYIINDETGFSVVDDQYQIVTNYLSTETLLPGVQYFERNSQGYFYVLERTTGRAKLLGKDLKEVPEGSFNSAGFPILVRLNSDAQTFAITRQSNKISCFEFKLP